MKERIKQIDSITDDFLTTFANLTPEQITIKPDEVTWSIAENIEHIIKVNSSYFDIPEQIKAGTYDLPLTARFNFFADFFGKTILTSVQPDRKKKTKTFAVWQPEESNANVDILNKFKSHQEELENFMIGCKHLVEKGTVISSPANRQIVYTLDTAFEIIIAHEKRHFEQAKDVKLYVVQLV